MTDAMTLPYSSMSRLPRSRSNNNIGTSVAQKKNIETSKKKKPEIRAIATPTIGPKRGDPNGLDRSRPRRHEGSRASHQPALEPATAIFSSPHPRLTSRWPWPCGAAGVPLFTPLATNIIRGRSLNPTKQSSHSLSFAHSPRLPTTISSAARGESRHAHFSPRS